LQRRLSEREIRPAPPVQRPQEQEKGPDRKQREEGKKRCLLLVLFRKKTPPCICVQPKGLFGGGACYPVKKKKRTAQTLGLIEGLRKKKGAGDVLPPGERLGKKKTWTRKEHPGNKESKFRSHGTYVCGKPRGNELGRVRHGELEKKKNESTPKALIHERGDV